MTHRLIDRIVESRMVWLIWNSSKKFCSVIGLSWRMLQDPLEQMRRRVHGPDVWKLPTSHWIRWNLASHLVRIYLATLKPTYSNHLRNCLLLSFLLFFLSLSVCVCVADLLILTIPWIWRIKVNLSTNTSHNSPSSTKVVSTVTVALSSGVDCWMNYLLMARVMIASNCLLVQLTH